MNWCGIYVIRYEGLTESIKFITKRMGINAFSLNMDNVSSEKRLSSEINQCFKTEQAVLLKRICVNTKYYIKFYHEST